ncbi:MAG TPA: hypothetical protein VGJ15_03940 [Pirellulales bacterium]|jgi:hypothetical protein
MRIQPRFNLRTLFALITLICVFCALLGRNVFRVHERERYFKRLCADDDALFGASEIRKVGEPPLIWRWLGARRVDFINLDRRHWTDDEIRQVESLFPEADIFVSNNHDYSYPPDQWADNIDRSKH